MLLDCCGREEGRGFSRGGDWGREGESGREVARREREAEEMLGINKEGERGSSTPPSPGGWSRLKSSTGSFSISDLTNSGRDPSRSNLRWRIPVVFLISFFLSRLLCFFGSWLGERGGELGVTKEEEREEEREEKEHPWEERATDSLKKDSGGGREEEGGE